jgi:hypothetical protein
MIRNIFILMGHDLAVAFKNKTVYLVIGIPLFVCATLALVDPAGTRREPVKIAWLRTEMYSYLVFANVRHAHPTSSKSVGPRMKRRRRGGSRTGGWTVT